MNKIEKAALKQQNALAKAIDNLTKFIDVAEKEEYLANTVGHVAGELETLADTYRTLYGAKR